METSSSDRHSAQQPTRGPSLRLLVLLALVTAIAAGCSAKKATVEATAYCACSSCCEWERGSWKYLKLDFWNRYISKGRREGKPYSGKTARGTDPREPHPGLLSFDTLKRPWVLPFRLLFPWLWFAKDGTIAADTKYFPFGTRMYVPGYGYGVVEDRGGAIKGPRRLDLYYDSHKDARRWGRRTLEVEILN